MLYGNVTDSKGTTNTVSKVEDVKDNAKVPKIESKVDQNVSEVSCGNVEVELKKELNQGCELPCGVILNINVNFPK